MTHEDKERTINNLRLWMEGVDDDETYGRMQAALRRIRAWDPAGVDPMPYQSEVEEWENGRGGASVVLPNVETAFAPLDGQPEGEEPTPVISATEAAEPTEPADPDDHLQAAYDSAVMRMEGGAFYEAMQEFRNIAEKAQGRLLRPAEELQFRAKAELEHRKAPLLDIARNATPDAAEAAWEAVRGVDPDDVEAAAALETLQSQAGVERTRRRAEEIRDEVESAFQRRNLGALNLLVGEVDTLRRTNRAATLRPVLDDLLQDVTQRRDQLRAQLGSPSTLIATGNNREAYSRARKMFDEKILTVVDTAGIMGGEPGAEVETARFLEKAREIYLAGLNKFAGDRLTVAEGEQGADPSAALETLNEVVAALTDDILSGDDRVHLQNSLDTVDKKIKSVELRLRLYEQARALVVAASEPGLAADDKYLKLRQAREIYREYPEIDDKLRAALTDVSAAAAADLEGEIALARAHIKRDQFDDARRTLQEARVKAKTKVPDPIPGSTLQQRLDELVKLDDVISDAEVAYDRLVQRLAGISDLLDDEDANRRPDNLIEARTRLESLSPGDASREEVVTLWGRLRRLQGLDSNWTEGRRAYQAGQWMKAIDELSLVANAKNHAAKEQATVMVERSEAALQVETGSEAEKERRYAEAYAAYTDALARFRQHDHDPQTQGARRTAETAVERLKPYTDGDLEVGKLRREAGARLAQARAITDSQRGSPSLLEPNQGYRDAIVKLGQASRVQYTNLGPQVEADLQKVRAQWEESNSEGMLLAVSSDDPVVLEKGIALGQELEKERLLTKPTNRDLLRRLRFRALDIEYKRLLSNRSTPPVEIENNRRDRLAHTPDDAGDRPEVEKQLSEAVTFRVIYEMGQKYEVGGADAALKYLNQEMSQPEVYGSRDLFHEFMQLLWEEERWEEARAEADRLRFRQLARPIELRQLWRDLTDAAERMCANDKNAFEAQLDALNEWFLAGGDYTTTSSVGGRNVYVWFADQNERRTFVNDVVAQLKVKRVEKLVGQAVAEQSSGNFLKAAQYYGYARLWNPGHPKVINGLQAVGPQLQNSLDSLLTRAGNVTLQTTSLTGSLETADEIWEQLVDIRGVGNALGLPNTTMNELSIAADSLKERIDGWKRVESILNEIEADARKALRNPAGIQNGQGGWDLTSVLTLFTNAVTEANKQSTDRNALITIISNRRNALNDKSSDADSLNKDVVTFLGAVDSEDFDAVQSLGKSLDSLWVLRQADGFDGLEGLITRKMFYGSGELRSLKAHINTAQNQSRDLARWQTWADKTVAAHEALDSAAAQMGKSLVDLRDEYSLKELKDMSEAALALVDQFLRTAGLKPEGNPLSQKAQEQRTRVQESWEEDLITADHEGPRYIILQRKGEIERDIEKLSGQTGPLQQLKTAMMQLKNAHQAVQGKNGGIFTRKPKGISDNLFKNAARFLKECRELDPSNPDVRDARKELQQLASTYNKQDLLKEK